MKQTLLSIEKMLSTLVATSTEFDSFTESTISTTHEDIKEEIKNEIKDGFKVNIEPMDNRVIIDNFVQSYYDALYQSQNSMIPTFSSIPSGNESGTYLAIDLGGSTLRGAVVEVLNKTTSTVSELSWLIGDDEKLMDEKFFDMIASRVKTVILCQDRMPSSGLIHCGMTWSFPLRQTKPNNGFLEDVSKGYILTSYSKGKDLKLLLEKAFASQGLQLSIDAIINDAISVVVAGKFLHNSTIGLVLGTGTNASISTSQQLLSSEKKLKNSDSDYLINTELSFFGYHLQHLATKYDNIMDKRWSLDFDEVPAPHMNSKLYGVFQPLELMTSGRYVMELIRLEMLDKANSGELNISADSLPSSYQLDAESICCIYEEGKFDSFTKIYGIELTDLEKATVIGIINMVIDRAVYVLGLALVALLEVSTKYRTLDKQLVINIGYVGSILQYFSGYRKKLTEFINKQQGVEVRFIYIENSSVNGAAIAAAVNNGQ